MADQKDFFRQIAVNYRQLAEIARNPELKQRMLDMAAHYQAKADEQTMTTSDAAARPEMRTTGSRR
jgi:hypothetical protein